MPASIEAVRADREWLLDTCAGLTSGQWQAPSGCAGWRVQDLVSHLGALFWAVVDPGRLPDVTGAATEQAQETWVQARSGLTADAVLADYKEASETALDRLAEIAALDLEVPLGDLGTYPASALPTAYGFDHYVHIRADLFPPRGPLDGAPPPSDELRLGTALDWVEAAIAQQNPAAAAAGSYELGVLGPCARVIRFGTGRPVARISSDGQTLLRWVTKRGSWAELGVRPEGDEAAITAAGTLKVF